MEAVATIPVKRESKRLQKKNFRDFCGKPLYEHFFKKLTPSNPFSEVYVNTDSDEVKSVARSYGFSVIDRPKWLSEDSANGNDLLLYDNKNINADIYFQLFVTAPLLKSKTIRRAYEIMTKNEEYDSIFTVTEENSFFWYKGSPVNYNPEKLPRTQDLTPMLEETTGLYGITQEALEENNCRIGNSPYMLPVSEYEGIDIDEKEDLELARIVYENMIESEDESR